MYGPIIIYLKLNVKKLLISIIFSFKKINGQIIHLIFDSQRQLILYHIAKTHFYILRMT